MKIDYSPFLHVLDNGSIWWPLDDAIKLGAGYLPMRDDEHNLLPVLRAQNNRVIVNHRTLLGDLNREHQASPHPWLLKREDGHYVEARGFLDWLSRYTTQRQTTIRFPDDLALAVQEATNAPIKHAITPQPFKSLTAALDGWLDSPLTELPDALRQRIAHDFFPMPWDILSPDQRRSMAQQCDYQNDPATEQERELLFDFFVRMRALRQQIEEWQATATPTASDLAQKEAQLKRLEKELAQMKQQHAQPTAPPIGSKDWRKQNAVAAANARHDQLGGSRDKKKQIRDLWATGKYSSRDICAEQECAALAMSFSTARNALKNTPDP